MVFWECRVLLRESSFEDVALASIATAKAIRQQRHHSLRLRGLVNLRHRQACDSAEQLTRGDIRPDAPGSYRRGKKLLESRAKARIEVFWQSRVGRLARVERASEPALGREEGGEALHPPPKRLERLMIGCQISRSLGAVIDLATEDGGDQVRPLRKVAVHRAHAQASLARYVADGGINPGDGENLLRRLEQRVETALRIRPQRLGCNPFRLTTRS